MCKYAQEKTALAKDDAEQKCPHNETTKILFADFSQGLSFHILEASSWERPVTTHPSLFNLAKLTYHKSQVFTHNQFLEKVGENQHVSADPVTADDMKD